jgi:hypothetical protein
VSRDWREVMVRRQQQQVMANAELGEQCVDRADLYARTSAPIAQVRRANVVVAIRDNERQCGELCDDVPGRAQPAEALQKFLHDESGGYDCLGAAKDGP